MGDGSGAEGQGPSQADMGLTPDAPAIETPSVETSGLAASSAEQKVVSSASSPTEAPSAETGSTVLPIVRRVDELAAANPGLEEPQTAAALPTAEVPQQVETAEGSKLTVLDAAEVRRSLEANGGYRIPQGTKVILEVQRRWKDGGTGRYFIPSQVTEENGLEVGPSWSFMRKDEVASKAGIPFPEGAEMTTFEPDFDERRREEERIAEPLSRIQNELDPLMEQEYKYGLTIKGKLAKRRLKAEEATLTERTDSMDRDLARSILARRPEFPGPDGEKYGLKLEDVERVKIITALSQDLYAAPTSPQETPPTT